MVVKTKLDFDGSAHNVLSELCVSVKDASDRKSAKNLFAGQIYINSRTLLRNEQGCSL